MNDRYSVIYSPTATDDLRSIYAYIAYELLAPQAARNTVNHIRSDVRKLDHFPERSRRVDWEPWASMGMRFMPVKNYVVYYLIDKDTLTVTIARVFYGGRNIEHVIQNGLE